MTALERDVFRLFHLRLSLEEAATPELESTARTHLRIPDDPRIDVQMAVGRAEFARIVTERVRRERGEEIELNRCPRCRRIPRTPRARQCLWCRYDWH
jgi:hypothetical protein